MHTVLDQILDVAQIDPECISPDYKLVSDLGVSRSQLQIILYKSAVSLGLPVCFENCLVEEASARQLTAILQGWTARSNPKVA